MPSSKKMRKALEDLQAGVPLDGSANLADVIVAVNDLRGLTLDLAESLSKTRIKN